MRSEYDLWRKVYDISELVEEDMFTLYTIWAKETTVHSLQDSFTIIQEVLVHLFVINY